MSKNWTVIDGNLKGSSLDNQQLQEALDGGNLEDSVLVRDGAPGVYLFDRYCGRPVLVLHVSDILPASATQKQSPSRGNLPIPHAGDGQNETVVLSWGNDETAQA